MLTNLMHNSAVRWARALVTPASKEETLNFVRFANEGKPDVTEMRKIANGSGGMPLDACGEGDGMHSGGMSQDDADLDHNPKDINNKITEWQAGWNVTNAIQVKQIQIYQIDIDITNKIKAIHLHSYMEKDNILIGKTG